MKNNLENNLEINSILENNKKLRGNVKDMYLSRAYDDHMGRLQMDAEKNMLEAFIDCDIETAEMYSRLNEIQKETFDKYKTMSLKELVYERTFSLGHEGNDEEDIERYKEFYKTL